MPQRRRRTLRLAAVLAGVAALAPAAPAGAYRPFDSTDADVVHRGVVELELQPVGYLDDDGSDLLVAPELSLNLGVWRDVELALEGRGLAPLERRSSAEERRYRLVGTGASLNLLLRRGSLHGGSGPSLSTELAALLPTVHGESGSGAAWVGALSQRWRLLSVHVNANAAYSRADEVELGGGLVLEGPAWRGLRPAVEGVAVRELGGTTLVSGLAGLIYEPRPGLAFDLGIRFADRDGAEARELRAGVTFGFRAF